MKKEVNSNGTRSGKQQKGIKEMESRPQTGSITLDRNGISSFHKQLLFPNIFVYF
jgi:hypothetical protein